MSPLTSGGNPGTVTVSLEGPNNAVDTSSAASVTMTLTGPGNYSHTLTVNASSGIATFNLSSLPLIRTGAYTLTVSGTGLATSTGSIAVVGIQPALALTLSSATVTAASPVTLTATATAGASPFTIGQAVFNYTQVVNGVTVSGSFGTGQFTSAGTSILTVRPRRRVLP